MSASHSDHEAGIVENHSVCRHSRPRHVVIVRAFVPDDEIVAAIPGGRRDLVPGPCGDRDPGRVENDARPGHPASEDVRIATLVIPPIRPGDEVVRPTGSDGDEQLQIRCRGDRDSRRIEYDPFVIDAGPIDVAAAVPLFVPGNEIGILSSGNCRAPLASVRVGRDDEASRIENGPVSGHPGAEHIRAARPGNEKAIAPGGGRSRSLIARAICDQDAVRIEHRTPGCYSGAVNIHVAVRLVSPIVPDDKVARTVPSNRGMVTIRGRDWNSGPVE